VTAPFTLDELRAASELVRRHVPPTPQYRWPLLEAHVPGAASVWVKHENHTPTGAFKVRGGLVHLARLARDEPGLPGVVSATRGNHGQSIALAAGLHGIPATIVVPHGNSPDKNAAMRAFGAELIEHGHDFQAAREHAAALAAERGLRMVPSFHHDLVLGVATYALELFEAVAAAGPPLDVVYVPVGMATGICALIAVRDLLALPTRIVGVVAERAPATALSFHAGAAVATDTADTFVDGVACRSPDPAAVAAIVRGAERIVQVPEEATARAIGVLHATTHNLAEPAGAIATAAMLAEAGGLAGRHVATVLTGGNLDAGILVEVLAGRTPRPA